MLDLGTGDAQTISALTPSTGLVVGVDRSARVLRAARRAGLTLAVEADAALLPFRDRTFETVLAADVLHHLADEALRHVLTEIRDVLLPSGRFVAWWYAASSRPAPDAPGYPRPLDVVMGAAAAVGLGAVEPLDLEVVLPGGPETVGLIARRSR